MAARSTTEGTPACGGKDDGDEIPTGSRERREKEVEREEEGDCVCLCAWTSEVLQDHAGRLVGDLHILYSDDLLKWLAE
jgi:hypothetical protein